MLLTYKKAVTTVALLAVALCSEADAVSPLPPRTAQLVVVELFESQGCSSCPPANANVNALSARSGVLTLIYGVTYWDQLGWRDTFARPEFTQRQRDYARGLGNGNVYTPQVVLNGRTDLVGANRAELDAAVVGVATTAFSTRVVVTPERVTVGARGHTQSAADVWLVRYDPRTLNVPIRAGENGGRTLPHVHVVRSIDRLGSWEGAERAYQLPPSPAPLRIAVLVQIRDGGPIIGAATGP